MEDAFRSDVQEARLDLHRRSDVRVSPSKSHNLAHSDDGVTLAYPAIIVISQLHTFSDLLWVMGVQLTPPVFDTQDAFLDRGITFYLFIVFLTDGPPSLWNSPTIVSLNSHYSITTCCTISLFTCLGLGGIYRVLSVRVFSRSVFGCFSVIIIFSLFIFRCITTVPQRTNSPTIVSLKCHYSITTSCTISLFTSLGLGGIYRVSSVRVFSRSVFGCFSVIIIIFSLFIFRCITTAPQHTTRHRTWAALYVRTRSTHNLPEGDANTHAIDRPPIPSS